MALPSSGTLSYGDVRSEVGLTACPSFSLAYQELVPSSGFNRLPINYNSTNKPNGASASSVSEWYGYDCRQATGTSYTITNLGNEKPGKPYMYMYVIDFGGATANWDVVASVNTGGSAASVEGSWGFPLNSDGTISSAPRPVSTGLTTTGWSTVFNYSPSAGNGQKVFFSIASIQNSNSNASWNITFTLNLTDVIIDMCGPAQAQCNDYYTFYAYADSNTTDVDTDIDISWTWEGDLSGQMNGSLTIPSGAGCTSNSFYSGSTISCLGENVSIFTIQSVSPSTSSTQEYIIGTTSSGSCASC